MTISCQIEKPLTCTDTKDDAALLVKVMGGTPPYQYLWNTALEGANPQNVGPGLFTVIVKDAKGLTKKASAQVDDNRMSVQIAATEDAKPNKKNGQAKLEVAGGLSPYK